MLAESMSRKSPPAFFFACSSKMEMLPTPGMLDRVSVLITGLVFENVLVPKTSLLV